MITSRDSGVDGLMSPYLRQGDAGFRSAGGRGWGRGQRKILVATSAIKQEPRLIDPNWKRAMIIRAARDYSKREGAFELLRRIHHTERCTALVSGGGVKAVERVAAKCSGWSFVLPE